MLIYGSSNCILGVAFPLHTMLVAMKVLRSVTKPKQDVLSRKTLKKRGSIMKVKITNKKDKTDIYSLDLSKAFGVRRMGDALIVYYSGSDMMFSFPSKQYKFEEIEMSADGQAHYIERSIEQIAEYFLYD